MEITTTSSLNGKLARLIFNEDLISSYGDSFFKDFIFEGTEAGTHFTLNQLDELSLTIEDNFHFTLIQSDNWEFGVHHNKEEYQKNHARFYFKYKNSDGYSLCPPKNEDPVYIGSDKLYDILITREELTNLSNSSISLSVRRVIDGDILFKSDSFELVSNYSNKMFSIGDRIKFGSMKVKSFRGGLDRLRIYTTHISQTRFLNHINFNEGYDTDKPSTLKDDLLLKVNFDQPYDISGGDELNGEIVNSALKSENRINIKTYNFKRIEYPYDFDGYSRREITSLPAFDGTII